MSDNPVAPSSEPSSRVWVRIGTGLAVCIILALAGFAAMRVHLAHRPVNLREPSASAADLLEKALKGAQVPDEAIQRAEPVLVKDQTAVWNAAAFEVDVPESIDPEGLVRLLKREMQKYGLSVEEEKEPTTQPGEGDGAAPVARKLALLFEGHAFISVELREQVRRDDLTAACAPIADAVAKFLAEQGIPAEAIRRDEPLSIRDGRADWMLTRFGVPPAEKAQVESLVPALQRAVAQLEAEVAARPSLNGTPKLVISYRGAACVEVIFGAPEPPAKPAEEQPAPQSEQHAPVSEPAPSEQQHEGSPSVQQPETPHTTAPAETPESKPAPETPETPGTTAEPHEPSHAEPPKAEAVPSKAADATPLANSDQKLAALLTEISKIPMDSAELSQQDLDSPSEPVPAKPAAAVPVKEPSVPVGKPSIPLPKKEPAPAAAEPRVAIVVDDGGYGGPVSDSVLTLDSGLTLAIMPKARHASDTARRAAEKGFGLLLHLPMESSRAEGELTKEMNEQQMESILRDALLMVPGAQGVNNHMGSLFTADAEADARLMAALKKEAPKLFFLDSRTTAKSEAVAQAHALGIPAIARDVFLDHEETPQFIRKQFARLIEIAKARGQAVAICHFRSETVQLLAELLPGLKKEGIKLVHVSELVQ